MQKCLYKFGVLVVYIFLLSAFSSHLPTKVFADDLYTNAYEISRDTKTKDASINLYSNGHLLQFNNNSYSSESASYRLQVEYLNSNKVNPESINTLAANALIPLPLERVLYKNLWNGIDVEFVKASGIVKSNYYLDEHANVEDIQLKYNREINIDINGNLVINFNTGNLIETAPIAWQEIDGQRKDIEVSYKLYDNRTLGFEIGNFVEGFPIVIDPELGWNTFLGGGSFQYGEGITLDSSGNIYVVGISTLGLGDTVKRSYSANEDIFVAKLDINGNYLWNTFLGGVGADRGYSIKLDSQGNIYVVGLSNSSWGDNIKKAFTQSNDIVVVKLDADGNYLWNAFLGGSGDDIGNDIIIDNNDNLYIVGNSSADWGSTINNAYFNAIDAVVVKMDSNGNYLWNSFFGGNVDDYGYSITRDNSNNLYVAGSSAGLWGTVVKRSHDNRSIDGFIVKMNSNGEYLWNSFFGAGGTDTSYGVSLDINSNIYISGSSDQSWGTNIKREYAQSNDGFITKLDSNGDYVWNAFLGGLGNDYGYDTSIDNNGYIYILGKSDAGWGRPLKRFYTAGEDAFVVKINSAGQLQLVTFLGGNGVDNAKGLTINSNNLLFISGTSSATWGSTIISPYFFDRARNAFVVTTDMLGNIVTVIDEDTSPVLTEDWSTDASNTLQTGIKRIGIIDETTSRKVAEFDVDFSTALDWSDLSARATTSKSLFHYPGGFISLPGASGDSYTLYIPKGNGNKVHICPGVDYLTEVSLTCAGGYFLDESSPNVSILTEESVTYWKVEGLTGTGGMSVIDGRNDNMSRLSKGVASDHSINFGTNYGLLATDTGFSISFDTGFDLSLLTINDIELTDSGDNVRNLSALPDVDTWGVIISGQNISFTVPTSGSGYYEATSEVIVNIGGNNYIINPGSVGSYDITVTLDNTDPGEQGIITVPIVDSDVVNVTGFVNSFINFDIDTTVLDTDCNYDSCFTHENGEASSNYTVDLGELSSSWVNQSNTNSVMHTQGGEGLINSIFIDLTTNAYQGAIVYVSSENAGLQGPTTNLIASVSDGEDILVNSGTYGFQLTEVGTVSVGTISRNSNCTSVGTYCALPSTNQTVFTTEGRPLDGGRLRMDIAAAAKYTNNPGLYTDTLTFTVVAIY